MPQPAQKESPQKSSAGWSSLLLAVPLVACCGLPLLLVAAATLGAALIGPIAAGIVAVGAVGFLLVRRNRAAACCAPEQRLQGDAPASHDQRLNGASLGGLPAGSQNGAPTETHPVVSSSRRGALHR